MRKGVGSETDDERVRVRTAFARSAVIASMLWNLFVANALAFRRSEDSSVIFAYAIGRRYIVGA